MSDPTPVIPIAIIAAEKPLPEAERTQTPMPPKTTRQEDLVVAGQRRINFIWETTQGVIAIGVTGAIIFSAISGASSPVMINVLTNAFFLIVGQYFSRTNHQMIGGVGRKASDHVPYVGR